MQPPPGRDYTRFLEIDALKGARIGIPRVSYYDGAPRPGASEPRGGLNDAEKKGDGGSDRHPERTRRSYRRSGGYSQR